ncbi:hypothetical protein GCM10029992_30270 [Glycomyces albus]
MTAESSQEHESEEPLNREQRRALARGKKGKSVAKQPVGGKKGKLRSQLPTGGVGKFQLPTKNG